MHSKYSAFARRAVLPAAAALSLPVLLVSLHVAAESGPPPAASPGPATSAEVAPGSSTAAPPGSSAAPSPDSSAAAAPDSSAAAAPDSSAAAAPEPKKPPMFDEQPFSDEKTPLPKDAEWTAAPKVTLDPGARERSCEARRVREWVRLSCNEGTFGAVRMLGGERDGVQMRLFGAPDEFSEASSQMAVMIPVRRGDARVIEVMSLEAGYKGSNSVEPWMVISESWPEEDDRPSFAVE